jgi:hypothetical protein
MLTSRTVSPNLSDVEIKAVFVKTHGKENLACLYLSMID